MSRTPTGCWSKTLSRIIDQYPTSATSPNLQRKLWLSNQMSTFAHEGISNKNQSACKVLNSTKIALIKIQNDIATSMDKGTAVGLVLLDLSTAFDTIDNSVLFDCLQYWYGIDGVVPKWVQSVFLAISWNRLNRSKTLVSSWKLRIQCKDTWLTYVAHVTTISGNYEGSTGI